MFIAGLIGGIAGVLGAGLGLYFMFRALGFFEYLGGKRKDPDAISKDALAKRLLDMNSIGKPYQISRGEESDLLAEWKIVDATWYGILSKNKVREVYRIIMLLDEPGKSVRFFEDLGKVQWSAGTAGLKPTVYYQKNFFRGRILFKKEWGVGYAFKDKWPPEAGKVYQYKFDVDEIRGPLKQVVEQSGWEWVPVSGRRHATYGKTD